MPDAFDDRKTRAAAWFRTLRDKLSQDLRRSRSSMAGPPRSVNSRLRRPRAPMAAAV